MVDPTSFNPMRRYRPSRWRGVENAIMTILTQIGVVPHSHVLVTRGRRTGRVRRNPVVVVNYDGRQWLVAPYGAVSWVHNAREAGRVVLKRRGDTRTFTVREVAALEAAPVLQKYVGVASATRKYFQADRNDPVERFAAEAHHHPVFQLQPFDAT